MSNESPVEVQRIGRVLHITINRPEARNAINTAASLVISAAMDELDIDPLLSCGIITGAGGTFCAGMDLKAFLAGERPMSEERGFAGIVRKPSVKPLIAAVEGHALAGGFEIVLACDLVVAAETSVFGLPEVRRGLMAGGGGLMRLPSRVPRNVAAEWVLTGRMVSASEAHAAGLINRLVPAGEALSTATELADVIGANGPLAVAGSKRVMEESRDWPWPEAFDRQQVIYEPVRSSDDAREGASAFAEKREPVWQGR
jgi:enoyl-CoA hydratase